MSQGQGQGSPACTDKGHHCHRDGDTGAHEQGTKDTDAVEMGTGELRHMLDMMLRGQGHTMPQRHRALVHTQAGTEDPNAIWMGMRNPSTHRQGSRDLHAVRMGTWRMQAGI